MISFFKKHLLVCLSLLLINSITAQLNNLAHFSYLESEEEFATMLDPDDTLFEKTYIVASREIEPLYMLNYEVSGHDFETFCKKTKRKMPSQPKGHNPLLPVVNVNHNDAVAYCEWLSSYYQVTFRLPSESEWEYAASIGFSKDKKDKNGINTNIVYLYNAKNEKPSCITCTQPNLYGLYHMRGNVWEITESSTSYADENTMTLMGGSFFEDADHVQANSKVNHNKLLKRADVGFRIVIPKRDYELLRFAIELQTLIHPINDEKAPITITAKGIYKGQLFIAWGDGFENFYYDEKSQTAGFCCWAQDINKLGEESNSVIEFSFKKEDFKQIQKIAAYFDKFPVEN